MIKLEWKTLQKVKRGDKKKTERELKNAVFFVKLEQAQNFAKKAEELGGYDFEYYEVAVKDIPRW